MTGAFGVASLLIWAYRLGLFDGEGDLGERLVAALFNGKYLALVGARDPEFRRTQQPQADTHWLLGAYDAVSRTSRIAMLRTRGPGHDRRRRRTRRRSARSRQHPVGAGSHQRDGLAVGKDCAHPAEDRVSVSGVACTRPGTANGCSSLPTPNALMSTFGSHAFLDRQGPARIDERRPEFSWFGQTRFRSADLVRPGRPVRRRKRSTGSVR